MSISRKIPIALASLLFMAAFSWLWFLKKNTGVPWDEPWEQALGKKSYDYAVGRNTDLLLVQNKYHGPAFEMLAEAISRGTGTYSYSGKLQVRRTVLVFFFLGGCLFLFLAVRRLTGNEWWALLSVVILFFTPRIMAHAAVNTKDIPILAVSCFFLWASVRFWKKPTLFNSLLGAMGAAWMVALRIPAIYVIPLWIFLWVFTYDRAKISVRPQTVNLLTFLAAVAFFTYAAWPILWNNPIQNFSDAWTFMSKYPWQNEVLFMGRRISALQLPATYIPVWMGITIPLAWIVFFIISGGVMLFLFIKRKKEAAFLIFLFGFVIAPIAAVIFLKSVVYDEWRHLFFIYPAFIICCVYGLYQLTLYSKRAVAIVIPVIFFTFIQVAEVVYWNFRYPLYSYVYFNPIARNNSCGNFEQDYWGFSYKQANEFLIQQFEGKPLKIHYAHLPGVYNHWALPDEDMAKLERVPFGEADYFITTHRFERETYNFGKTVFEIRVNECAIMTVYKKQ